MSNAVFSFCDVENKVAKPAVINEIIGAIMREDNGACYTEMEPYLLNPGKNGSRSFDQAECIFILLAHDRKKGEQLADILAEKPNLTKRHLWSHLSAVLRKAGFLMSHGRVAGLLEHKDTATEEPKTEELLA